MKLSKKEFCPICGQSNYQPLKNGLLKCCTCGVSLSPQVWNEGENKACEDEWFENKPSHETVWLKSFQFLNNRRTWKRLQQHLHSGMSVLEIGVGSGSLLRYLRDRGLRVEGCDLAKSICENIRKTDGIPMYNCSVREINDNLLFDGIVMNHVLEHVSNPVQFLKDVRCHIATKGCVHIAVPNVTSWEAMLSGWCSYEPYHLIYFSPGTLRRAVEESGFEVLSIATYDSFSGWFLAVLRTLLRTNKKNAGERFKQRENVHLSWVGHTYHLAMVLSGVITWPLRLFQEIINRGDEVVLIAQKLERKAI
jgi:cyclopropane fatty-acyl-phospholipid synthase-like methyltransferase